MKMRKNKLYKTSTVFVIILLITGATLFPSIGGNIGTDTKNGYAPDIEVNKKVKEDCSTHPWHDDGVDIDMCDPDWYDWVTFNITVTNTGDYVLDITIEDCLDDCLIYIGGSADPEPSIIQDPCYYWVFNNVQPGESRYIEYHAGMGDGCDCDVKYWNDVNATGVSDCDGTVYDEDMVWVRWLCCEPCTPDIEVNKKVKEDCSTHPWHDDGVDIDMCDPEWSDWVTFNITVTNTGDVDLDITVEDCLDECLIYIVGSGIPEPTSIQDPCYFWVFNDVPPGESRYIEYRAEMGDCCDCDVKYWNDVNATGVSDCADPVYDEDMVWVRWLCCEPCTPDIEVNKKVKEDCSTHPWHDDGVDIDMCDPGWNDWVTFNITVTNTGDVDLDITVEDCLDECLLYMVGSGIPEPTSLQDPCYFWVFNDVPPGESRYIEYRAEMGDCCDCDVKYWNDVNATGVSDCADPVYDEDMVWVQWLCCEPCTPDIEVNKKVKEDCSTHPWHDDGVDIDMCDPEWHDWVTFNITVTNTGDVDLDITVEDCLDECLIYIIDSGIPEPTSIQDPCYFWVFNDVPPGESRYIEYRAEMGDCCDCDVKYWNDVNATGVSDCADPVYDEDMVWVQWLCCEPCTPDIEVNKKVKEDCSTHPWHDDGVDIDMCDPEWHDWVTFNITVTNTGDVDLNITVEDCLDECLIYIVGSGIPEPTFIQDPCYFWVFNDVPPGESRYIEYRAEMGDGCDCDVKYWNDVNATGVSDCADPVYDEDMVWVQWLCCEEITVEKYGYAKLGTEEPGWVKWIEFDVNIHLFVEFILYINTTGIFEEIIVEDCLPPGLTYNPIYTRLNGEPFEDPTIIDNCLSWTIIPDENYTIGAHYILIYAVDVLDCGDWINAVTVSGRYNFDHWNDDFDNATIHAFGCCENNPPNPPIEPNPENGKTNVDIDRILTWTGGDPDSDPVTYDVYFGIAKSSFPKLISNQSITTFDPGELQDGMTYYWKIVAWDDKGASTEGDDWSFTTQVDDASPIVEIIKPENAIYISNVKIIPSFIQKPIIIGDIDITVNANDFESEIEFVKFYIDGELKWTDINEPYSWTWQREKSIRLRHTIEIVVNDKNGNEATREMSVWKIL